MTTVDDKEAKKAAREARSAELAAKQTEANTGKTGKGTRTFFGMTRGQNPLVISFENWDIEKEVSTEDSLPTTFAEVLEIHKARNQEGDAAEKEIVRRWILGDNEILYTEASDPIAEFVDAAWPDDVQKAFRLNVRAYSNNADVSIEDAVAIIKPAFDKAHLKRTAAAAESK